MMERQEKMMERMERTADLLLRREGCVITRLDKMEKLISDCKYAYY